MSIPPAIDLQVNGYAGVDFNADGLTEAAFAEACALMKAHGVAKFLPTVITAETDAMCRRLAALRDLSDSLPIARQMVAGIHIEGPFLNEQAGYVGAHPVAAVQPANVAVMQRLLEAAGPLARIVTLAPERDPDFAVTRFLHERGVIVAAGHCDPSLSELNAAIDAGLSMFTHLGNGCPMQMHRHDNIVQRVLSLDRPLWIGFIADGAHVPLFALKNYLRCAGIKRCFVVTDAISAAGLGPGSYTLGDQQVEIGEDLIPWAADRSHFIGSATTMSRMIANLRHGLGLDDEQIAMLVSENPAMALSRSGIPA
ncbi:MAG: N-acetylglucosamine-6-phosphate deacetylase [Pirellulales bacterium]